MKLVSHPKTLKIAFASPWKNIHPGLQHTLIGDLTLSNQFEALVGFNDNGVYVPLAATEWTISHDFKVFTFKIDTSKKFSDGVKLSATHFKESWERALRLVPKSSNSSLLDVLYKLEGFGEFERAGTLSGIIARDDETLELRFATPFRMALEHLSGNRFSAYREEGGKFLGTGAYLIEDVSPELLKLTPNLYFSSPARNSIELSVVTSKDSVAALREGKIEVMAYAMGGAVSDDLATNTNLSFIVGQDALHRAIYPNSQKGHLFEKKEYRQALQYLVTKYLEDNPNALGNPMFTAVDAQAYLPLQAGRIDESVASTAIKRGEEFVPALLKAATENPPVLIETDDFSLKPMLAAIGLSISKRSRTVSKSDFISIIYSGDEADLMPGSFGVASGDPDGIYHLLGRNGAITSPMLKNERVAQLLEDGRKLIDRDAIDPFYQKVSLQILNEAPIVHLGFNKAVAIYRNDVIKLSGRILRRNEGHLRIFEERE